MGNKGKSSNTHTHTFSLSPPLHLSFNLALLTSLLLTPTHTLACEMSGEEEQVRKVLLRSVRLVCGEAALGCHPSIATLLEKKSTVLRRSDNPRSPQYTSRLPTALFAKLAAHLPVAPSIPEHNNGDDDADDAGVATHVSPAASTSSSSSSSTSPKDVPAAQKHDGAAAPVDEETELAIKE